MINMDPRTVERTSSFLFPFSLYPPPCANIIHYISILFCFALSRFVCFEGTWRERKESENKKTVTKSTRKAILIIDFERTNNPTDRLASQPTGTSQLLTHNPAAARALLAGNVRFRQNGCKALEVLKKMRLMWRPRWWWLLFKRDAQA